MVLAVQSIQEKCPPRARRLLQCDGRLFAAQHGVHGAARPVGRGHRLQGLFEFTKAIAPSPDQNANVGAMELIALDMKRRGMYISRQLSFKSAEFDTTIVDPTPRQKAMYDAASAFWSELLCCF